MVVYKPVYTNKWEIRELESDLLRHMTGNMCAYFKKGIGFYGSIYDIDTIFKTKEAAHKYIWGDYVPNEDRFKVLIEGRDVCTEQ